MKDSTYKKYSLISLISGYMLATGFIIMLILNTRSIDGVELAAHSLNDINNTVVTEKILYMPPRSSSTLYVDHLSNTIIDDMIHEPINTTPGTVIRDGINTVHDNTFHYRDRDRVNHHSIDNDIIVDGYNAPIARDGRNHLRVHEQVKVDDVVDDPDYLDRRIKELENTKRDESHIDTNIGNLTVVSDDAGELGDIDDFTVNVNEGYGVASGGLYAYNYPGRGVGAGVGSGSVGASAGGSAGLGAGIGQGVTAGETVPTLGGVGTYATPGNPAVGGVGGLVSGAGAGGAAGLTVGTVLDKLGMTPLGTGIGGGYNYDHLPKDGALHIMMHVDGSGSILNTRKQLDIMKNTLLKDALLPYYNNDVELYNRRVTIVSSSGERTLRFFREAAKKDNVLAIAFQDEAQPAYHLPNFNRKPEEHYLDDMNNLKASLNGYAGLYRGVMFQVDRGNTFAKSFKEFVNNSFRGEGYLEGNGLKKYYRDNNIDNIRNKDGIVFSDEYHAKDSGDSAYYLDLILNAVSRVGLDLRENNGGLNDGIHIH